MCWKVLLPSIRLLVRKYGNGGENIGWPWKRHRYAPCGHFTSLLFPCLHKEHYAGWRPAHCCFVGCFVPLMSLCKNAAKNCVLDVMMLITVLTVWKFLLYQSSGVHVSITKTSQCNHMHHNFKIILDRHYKTKQKNPGLWREGRGCERKELKIVASCTYFNSAITLGILENQNLEGVERRA